MTAVEQLLLERRAAAESVLHAAVPRVRDGAVLPDLDPVARCAHLAGQPVAYLCGAHPAAGLLCTDCRVEHGRRHGTGTSCAGCGDEHATVAADVDVRVHLATRVHPGLVTRWAGVVCIVLGPLCPGCVPDQD